MLRKIQSISFAAMIFASCLVPIEEARGEPVALKVAVMVAETVGGYVIKVFKITATKNKAVTEQAMKYTTNAASLTEATEQGIKAGTSVVPGKLKGNVTPIVVVRSEAEVGNIASRLVSELRGTSLP